MYGRTKFEVKPMRFYKEEEHLDFCKGDVVVAKVIAFHDSTIWLKVGEMDAIMKLEDVNDYDYESKNAKFIVSQIGKNILARVCCKKDNILVLERRSIVKETLEVLKRNIGNDVPATVEKIETYGAFADIGNGIISLMYAREVSKSRFYDLSKVLSKGEIIKVKILNFDPETSYFTISRKQAYYDFKLEEGMITMAICSQPIIDETGIYVECNPGHTGIMDFPENMSVYDFEEGKKVRVIITRLLDVGFRADFIGFV